MAAILKNDKQIIAYFTKLVNKYTNDWIFVAGPSGTGKSHIVNILKKSGIRAVDTDEYGKTVITDGVGKFVVDYTKIPDDTQICIGISNNYSDIISVVTDELIWVALTASPQLYKAIAYAKFRHLPSDKPAPWFFDHWKHMWETNTALTKSMEKCIAKYFGRLEGGKITRFDVINAPTKLGNINEGWEGKSNKNESMGRLKLQRWTFEKSGNTILIKIRDPKQQELLSLKVVPITLSEAKEKLKWNKLGEQKYKVDNFADVTIAFQHDYHYDYSLLNPETAEVRHLFSTEDKASNNYLVIKEFPNLSFQSFKWWIGDLGPVVKDWNTTDKFVAEQVEKYIIMAKDILLNISKSGNVGPDVPTKSNS